MADTASFTLTGDKGPLERVLDGAVGLFKSFGNKVSSTLKTVFSVLMDQVPLFMADLGTGLRAGFGELAASEAALSRVQSLLKSTGGVSGKTAQELQEMADALAEVSAYGDDAVLAAQAVVLQFKNVRGDIFDDAIQAAADLASATDTDLSGAADRLGRALDDPIRGLRLLRLEGVRFTAAETQMIEQMVLGGRVMEAQRLILDRMNESFGGAAEGEVSTFSGKIKQLNNILGDQWKAIANALTPALEAVIPWIKEGAIRTTRMAEAFRELVVKTVEWANQSRPVINQWITQVSDGFAKVALYIIDRMTEAFTFVETGVKNFPELVASASATAQLYWAQIAVKFTQIWEETSFQIETVWTKTLNAMTSALAVFVTGSHKMLTDLSVGMGDALRGLGDLFVPSTEFERITREQERQRQLANAAAEQAKIAATIAPPRPLPQRGPSSVTKDDLDRIEELRKKADEAAAAFGDKFGPNLEKNKKFIEGFKKKIGEALGLTGGDVKTPGEGGKAPDAPFTFDKEAKEGKAGAFEDLLSLQKRISGAAFKSPEATATDQQTVFIKQAHHATIKEQKEQQKKLDKMIETTEKVENAVLLANEGLIIG